MSTSADDSAVMVCVDGSPASDAAVRWAAACRSSSPGCQRHCWKVVMSNEYLEHISEATLLDGGLVSLRRLDLDDLDGIIALSETLTESERYFRFFTAHPTLEKLGQVTRRALQQAVRTGSLRKRQIDRGCQLLHVQRAWMRRSGDRRCTPRTYAGRGHRVAWPAWTNRPGQRTGSSRGRRPHGELLDAQGDVRCRVAVHHTC